MFARHQWAHVDAVLGAWAHTKVLQTKREALYQRIGELIAAYKKIEPEPVARLVK